MFPRMKSAYIRYATDLDLGVQSPMPSILELLEISSGDRNTGGTFEDHLPDSWRRWIEFLSLPSRRNQYQISNSQGNSRVVCRYSFLICVDARRKAEALNLA